MGCRAARPRGDPQRQPHVVAGKRLGRRVPAPSVPPQDRGDDKRVDPISRHIRGGDVEGGQRASHPPRHDDLDGGITGLVPAVPKNGLLASIARGMLGDRHERKQYAMTNTGASSWPLVILRSASQQMYFDGRHPEERRAGRAVLLSLPLSHGQGVNPDPARGPNRTSAQHPDANGAAPSDGSCRRPGTADCPDRNLRPAQRASDLPADR